MRSVGVAHFVPTMHRAMPGRFTLPSASYGLTASIAVALIRSRAASSTWLSERDHRPGELGGETPVLLRRVGLQQRGDVPLGDVPQPRRREQRS